MSQLDRIIRVRTVLDYTGLSRSTLYPKMKDGTFPAKIGISANGTGWHESHIDRWAADSAGWKRRARNEFDLLED